MQAARENPSNEYNEEGGQPKAHVLHLRSGCYGGKTVEIFQILPQPISLAAHYWAHIHALLS